VTHLVYSHHHADHGGASSLFGSDVIRIGHQETKRLLRRDKDPARPLPDVTFQDRYTLEVGAVSESNRRLGEALAGTSEDLRLMIDVSVGTARWLTQAVAPYMLERGSGAVVHVAARSGLEPTAGMATFGVSKGSPDPPHPRARPGTAPASGCG
jgi:NAD(P)-dependent dehydrogenase (short-subunit alcohol dehydrogenase family)